MRHFVWSGPRTSGIAAIAALLTFGLTAAMANADQAPNSAAAQKQKKKAPKQVPETGEDDGKALTAEEEAAEEKLVEMLSRSDAGLAVVERADGTQSADLEGRFMNVAFAHRNPDGTWKFDCVASHSHVTELRALAAVAKKSPKANTKLEEKE